jgi:hypothetical protein
LAVANYHDNYGSLPPAYIADRNGTPMHSWRVLLLPFLEQQALYEEYNFDEPWNGPNNRKLLAKRPSVYAFSDSDLASGGVTNYLAVVGNETVWPFDKSLSLKQIADGGNTIIVVENHSAGIQWTEPRDLEFATMNFDVAAEPADGVSSRFDPPAVVTLDGSVQALSMRLPPAALRARLTANGQEEAEMSDAFSEIADGRNRPVKEAN